MSYGGLSLDKLTHRCFAMPYNHVVANFVSAYQELAIVCIDGRTLQIAYSDMRTANISTLSEPSNHIPGQRVPCVVVDAEGVALGSYTRSVFNSCCDAMMADFELQCDTTLDHGWRFLSGLLSKFFTNSLESMAVWKSKS